MEFLLKAAAVIAIFYLCYKLFLQGETFFESNRWFLLSGLVFSVCMPFLVIPIYVETEPITAFSVTNVTSSTLQAIAEEKFDYISLLSLLYIIGVLFFLTKLTIEFSSLFKLLNNHVYKSSGNTKYIETENAISPFSFFNYIVYNPKQFSTTELEHIINHEQVHARQWHSIDIIIVQLATVVFWFNPLIWFYKKDLQQNLEFIADKNAQQVSDCHKSYQHLLLKASIPNQQLVLANPFYNSLIKKRIVMLHKSKSHKLNVLKYVLIVPLLTVFLMSFNTKEVYVESDNTVTNIVLDDIETAIITKGFKDADFEKLKKEFKAHGVTLKFNSIKRNASGEITAIKINAKSSKSSASFNSSSDEGIKPIKITYNSDGQSISIGNGEGHNHFDYHFKSKNGNHQVVTSGSGSNVFVVSEDHQDHKDTKGKVKYEVHKKHSSHNNHNIDEDHEMEVIIENHDHHDDVKHKIILKGDNSKDGLMFISANGNENPLIIIDGKESSKEALEKLMPQAIEKMEVLKDDSATNIYGNKAKEGVIIISTKKK